MWHKVPVKDWKYEKDLTHWCWFEDRVASWQGTQETGRSWERLPTDSQQGNNNLNPTTARNWILPTLHWKWICLEADSSLEPQDESPSWLTPQFYLYESWSKGTRCPAELTYTSDLQNCEKIICVVLNCFVVIC